MVTLFYQTAIDHVYFYEIEFAKLIIRYLLDNRYALLFVRGERPVMDFKYDILKHPNVKLTVDGGQPPYIHGEPMQAVATIVFDSDIPDNAVSVKAVSTSYELLSDEDLEEIFNL